MKRDWDRMSSQVRVLEMADFTAPDRREWTLGDLFAALRRRRSYLIWSTAAMLLLATAYCLLATPRFQATGKIEVQKEMPGVFGLESSVMGDSSNAAPDSLDYGVTLETEANILQSETLALEVVKDLKLETTKDYYPPHQAGVQLPAWLFFWKKPVEPMSVPLDDAPNRRYVVLKIFASHLKVAAVAGTRLIEVSYSDPDPRLAAAVVNRLIQSLTDYTFQARFDATLQASKWLGNQLVGLKKQTEVLQQKAIRLQRDTGLYGEDDTHNIVLARLETLNEALSAAESNRILKEAIYRVSQSGDPELISGLAGNSGMGTTPAMTNTLALLQTLRAQEAPVRAELAEDETRYGSAYPRIAELHAQLDGIEKSIHDEVRRVGERSRTDYEIAAAAEGSARDAFEKQKTLANETNDRAVAYELAKQEADGSRNIYQGLLAKLKQAGVLEGLRSTNMTIVNPGRVPPTDRPHSPNVPLYYAAALVAGLFFGSSAALLRELHDDSVQSLEELEQLLGAPLLGVVPKLEERWRRPHLRSLRSAKSQPEPTRKGFAPDDSAPFTEALRSLRTSLLIGQAPRTLLVTSAVAGEGKSRLAIHLAGTLAQLGRQVLLVDTDLRCPSLHVEFGLPHAQGLAAVLADGASPAMQPHPQLPQLSMLCGSATPALPSELLASQRMVDLLAQWRAEYDFVVLDSPPVLPVADARILSRLCDATLLVARHGVTSRQAIQRSYQLIQQQLPAHAVLGAVLNGVSEKSAEYYSYYGYKSSARKKRRHRHADA